MRNLLRYLAAGGILLISVVSTHAQAPLKNVFKTPQTLGQITSKRVINSAEVSRQLHLRAYQTWLEASILPRHVFWPSSVMFPLLPVNPYPAGIAAGQLTTPDQWSQYFLTKNNLEIRKWLPQFEKREKFIQNNLSEFVAAKQLIYHTPKEDVAWLSDQIPTGTNYLFLGEEHHAPEIQEFISDFLPALRAQIPQNREIFLFTEFVDQNKTWSDSLERTSRLPYLPVWLSANARGIRIVGLEPEFVTKNNASSLILPETAVFPPPLQIHTSVWTSIEGVRLRNEHWLARLRYYRTLHPDALFVIYCGNNHADYMMPYSLGKRLQAEGGFVISLESEKGNGEFRHLSYGLFTNRILKFNDETLTRFAGFDIQLKIPNQ